MIKRLGRRQQAGAGRGAISYPLNGRWRQWLWWGPKGAEWLRALPSGGSWPGLTRPQPGGALGPVSPSSSPSPAKGPAAGGKRRVRPPTPPVPPLHPQPTLLPSAQGKVLLLACTHLSGSSQAPVGGSIRAHVLSTHSDRVPAIGQLRTDRHRLEAGLRLPDLGTACSHDLPNPRKAVGHC